MKKLDTLSIFFKPFPFLPSKTLDFLTHEKLLKRIGLWEFVHVKFECDIRTDLLTQLIVNFDPHNGCSYINDTRIRVSCTDLACALKLPLQTNNEDNVMEKGLLDELIVFVEDLVFNWVLLHENSWILPEEVLNWTRVIKEGHPEKVDWASLMWYMVERELVQGSGLGHCYYASHLQCLIKSQCEVLFLEKPVVDIVVIDDDEDDMCEVEASEVMQMSDKCSDVIIMKMDEDVSDVSILEDGVHAVYEVEGQNNELSIGQNSFEVEYLVQDYGMDFKGQNIESLEKNIIEVEHLGQEYGMDFEGQNVELSLGKNRTEVEHLVRNYGKECEEHEHGQFLLHNEKNVGEEFLQRCHDRGLLSDEEEEDDQAHEQEQQEEELTLFPGYNPMEAIDSAKVIQEMELQDYSVMEQFTSRDVPSYFGNVCKKEIDHDHHISRQSLNDNHKRPRSDDEDSDFDLCMENIHNWVGKAKMFYHEKEHTCTDLNVDQETINELQKRDDMIEHLQKVRFEEQQKRQAVIYQLEGELYGMGKLLKDYRKALKETNHAFSEYKLKHEEEEMMKRKQIEVVSK